MPIYEIGEHEGQQYYSMRFVEGTSLARLPRGDVRTEVAKLVEVVRAVHHAHQHRVLHRDLKPSNVLVDMQGTRFVTDFGLAKRLSDVDRSLTATGQLVGTPRYMAPEQSFGRKDLTVAADVYSLGVILYERLTGQTPFTGDDVLKLAAAGSRVRTPAAVVDRAGTRSRSRDHRSQVSRQGPGALLRDRKRTSRRPGQLPGRPADHCTACRPDRTGVAVVPQEPVVATLAALLFSSLVAVAAIATVFAVQSGLQVRREKTLTRAAQDESARATKAAREAREQSERSDRIRYVAEINAAASDYQLGNIKVGAQPSRRARAGRPGRPIAAASSGTTSIPCSTKSCACCAATSS